METPDTIVVRASDDTVNGLRSAPGVFFTGIHGSLGLVSSVGFLKTFGSVRDGQLRWLPRCCCGTLYVNVMMGREGRGGDAATALADVFVRVSKLCVC